VLSVVIVSPERAKMASTTDVMAASSFLLFSGFLPFLFFLSSHFLDLRADRILSFSSLERAAHCAGER
jgi:hypothetical protein